MGQALLAFDVKDSEVAEALLCLQLCLKKGKDPDIIEALTNVIKTLRKARNAPVRELWVSSTLSLRHKILNIEIFS